MPYTRISLITTGVVKSSIICDLETGFRTVINCDNAYQAFKQILSRYAGLALSSNLEERKTFDVIYANVAAFYVPKIKKKKLSKMKCQELLGLINRLNIADGESKTYWGYRDGWNISLLLSGEGSVPKKDRSFFQHQ